MKTAKDLELLLLIKEHEKQKLQLRINQAIEELEIWQPKEKILQEEKEYLLDILKGDDKE